MKYILFAGFLFAAAFSQSQCTADFDTTINGLTIDFTDQSTGGYDSLWFDFGDGNGSSSANTSHTYTTSGTYTVCLTVYDSTAFCDSTCYSVTVGNVTCDADFSFETDGLTVDFTNESTGLFNAQTWDFDDGFGFSEDSDPSYTYFAEGTYEVCLYVYDSVNFSCESEHCAFVTVEDDGGGGGNCEANFFYKATELKVSFTNLSFGGLITTWNFGDGSGPNFDQNPVHTFDEPGEYEVCITVFNPIPFCTDEYCETIEVFEFSCEPEFVYTFDYQTNTYKFNNTTVIGEVTSVKWDFGDGNTSTFDNPTYTYNAVGPYKVCLTTYEDGNQCGTTCQDIVVNPLGVEAVNQSTDMVVFPNPNQGSFTILLNGNNASQIESYSIVDLAGRTLLTSNAVIGSNQIEVNEQLPAGVYQAQVNFSTGQMIRSQFIVQ